MNAALSPLPLISSNQLIKFFIGRGFVKKPQKRGSHVVLKKKGIKRPIVIPANKKELHPAIVINNIKTAEISREEFIRAIQKHPRAS